MGRHNGGTRSKGGNLTVGAALTNKQKGKLRPGAPKGSTEPTSHRHTTEAPASSSGLQSMLDASDLGELMDMASLANRDFSAEKACDAVIIGPTLVENGGTGGAAGGPTLSPEERDAAEAAAADALKLPRRPKWSPEMSAAELDTRERASFVSWRRALAALEASGTVPLTPFEKNLDVWRQLWRVIERSHVLVQVVDARDPLRYLSADLALAAAEAAAPDPPPPLLVLLNKADLLPREAREAWASELERRGLLGRFAWWSAKAAGDAAAEQASAVVAALSAGLPPPDFPRPQPTGESDRTRILGAEELLEWLEREARAAAKGATGRRAVAASFLGESDSEGEGEEDHQELKGRSESDNGETEEERHRRETSNRRPTAGFVGFPNVGKSSTLNALFGRKKAAVAPTPGKTKHFQTLDLFVSGGGGDGGGRGRTLTLCDCPGLVFPRVASSKADMVAAGVVPIDRLTDVRAPVAVVCAQVGRGGLERAYGVRLPPLRAGETRASPPFAADVLRAVALSRGWVVQNALPDESRAGRMILRDHCSGKLPHFCWPPGKEPKRKEGEEEEEQEEVAAAAAAAVGDDSSAPQTPDARLARPPSPSEQRELLLAEEARAEAQRELDALALNGEEGDDDDIDLEALEAEAALAAAAGASGSKQQQQQQQQQRARRAAHKFQKRPARSKGDRGQGRQGLDNGYDGAAMATGKKGGLVRGGVMMPAL